MLLKYLLVLCSQTRLALGFHACSLYYDLIGPTTANKQVNTVLSVAFLPQVPFCCFQQWGSEQWVQDGSVWISVARTTWRRTGGTAPGSALSAQMKHLVTPQFTDRLAFCKESYRCIVIVGVFTHGLRHHSPPWWVFPVPTWKSFLGNKNSEMIMNIWCTYKLF